MDNELLKLFEKQDTVSMNNDIFPIIEQEFENMAVGDELYELAHQYIAQLLYGVFVAGVGVVAIPVFGCGELSGQLVVTDVIYKKLQVSIIW